ncbi:MAG: hypothetical protein CM1200mP2_09060 [Planctomycetaceae bacterium]|nr:MAG: hypothetical protein CM1200mP2_09060 [Planctomycetaceae bacterium]
MCLRGQGPGKSFEDQSGDGGLGERLVSELVAVQHFDGRILRDPSGQGTFARPDPADQSHDRSAMILWHGVVL